VCMHGRDPGAAFWWRRYFRRFGSREDWLERLEEYQRDLEQELADVADIIRRLKEEGPPQTASV
jgi:N-acetyl-anhydromuramyl-L-alanine amidase AmpD